MLRTAQEAEQMRSAIIAQIHARPGITSRELADNLLDEQNVVSAMLAAMVRVPNPLITRTRVSGPTGGMYYQYHPRRERDPLPVIPPKKKYHRRAPKESEVVGITIKGQKLTLDEAWEVYESLGRLFDRITS